MKQSEIRIGKFYTNGKGKVRKIVAIERFGPTEQIDIRYREKGCPQLFWIYLKSFARWAKEEVK